MAKKKDIIPSLKGYTPANLRAVAESFLKMVGGPEGLARNLLLCFQRSPKGGMTQAKILFEMMNALRATDEKSGKEDLQHLTDEDLRREAEPLLKKALEDVQPDAAPTSIGSGAGQAEASPPAEGT